MAPKAKSSALKQGTLAFASSKRNASATASGKANVKANSPATTTIKPSPSVSNANTPAPLKSKVETRRVSNQNAASSTEEDFDVLMISTGAEPVAKRQKISSGTSKSVASRSVMRRAPADSSESESDSDSPREDLDVLENGSFLNQQYGLARARMGDVTPVHSQGKTKAYQILRVFDLSYEYGPCVGVSRLERWERAHMLGLNPPMEVREVLKTNQGIQDDLYKQNVFYAEGL